MTVGPKRRPGRPDGISGGQTRRAILDAAGRQFAERGFDQTSMRSVAGEAGVDPTLITHYFGTKQRLFVEAVALPIEPAVVLAQVLEGDPGAIGLRLARLIMSVLEAEDGRSPMIGLVRAAASHPGAARLVRERLARELLGPIAAKLGHSNPELRTSLVMSQVVGLVMARYVVGVEPLASAAPETVIHAVAPTLQRYLTGDLGLVPPAPG